MQARVENGFWVFRAPVGYRYVSAPLGGGKVLEAHPVLAPVVRAAFEGFANGRFAFQAEVQRFLERDPYFPKDHKDGTLRPMTVSRLLRKVVYAGYVEAPKWGVDLHQGRHEGLISFETYQRIIDHLDSGKRRPAARADYNEDFPLRGFVACDCCGNAMTAAWSKGKYKRYAYYRCETRGCEAKIKSIPRAKLEAGFEEILARLEPARGLFNLAKAMLTDAWNMRLAMANGEKAELEKQRGEVERQIQNLLDKVVDVGFVAVSRAYEKRIDSLERRRLVIAERCENYMPPEGGWRTVWNSH